MSIENENKNKHVSQKEIEKTAREVWTLSGQKQEPTTKNTQDGFMVDLSLKSTQLEQVGLCSSSLDSLMFY